MKNVDIFLVPGFFGFDKLEALRYFDGVTPILTESLHAAGIRPTIHIHEPPLPAGSVVRRARALAETVAKKHDRHADCVHFVGHSMGGLDIRVLLDPSGPWRPCGTAGASLLDEIVPPSKLGAAVTLSTPHYGTPIVYEAARLGFQELFASFGVLAQCDGFPRTLARLSVALTLSARVAERLGIRGRLFEWMVDEVFRYTQTDSRGIPLRKMLRDIGLDQGGMLQMSQYAMHVFNASVATRSNVEWVSYASLVPPGKSVFPNGDFALDITTLLFRFGQWVTSRRDPHYEYAPLEDAACDVFLRDLGFLPDPTQSDGIVPTLSQVFGRLGGAFEGDHLDVVGMFPHTTPAGTDYVGWVCSGAGFDQVRLRALWGRIAGDIAAATMRRVPQPAASNVVAIGS
ncbi:MAG TPA: hypothetical protein VM580_04910 [Labilithrix sp.]|nr:hypothetical protein [Labilithrix sp.]